MKTRMVGYIIPEPEYKDSKPFVKNLTRGSVIRTVNMVDNGRTHPNPILYYLRSYDPILWVESLLEEEQTEEHAFRWFGAGEVIDGFFDYVDTVICGCLVFHLFEDLGYYK